MSKKHINRANDEEIIGIVRSILSQGTMVVETTNEAVLVALMEKRGTPIENYASLRNIKQTFEQYIAEGIADGSKSKKEHDSNPDCWCEPELDGGVWVHKDLH